MLSGGVFPERATATDAVNGQLTELTAKLKEERDAREQTAKDLELTQRSLKKTIAQAARYSKQVKHSLETRTIERKANLTRVQQ